MKLLGLSIVALTTALSPWAHGEKSFASYLSQDCSVYFESYNQEGMLPEPLLKVFFESDTLRVVEDDDPKAERLREEKEDLSKILADLGPHFTLAVGGEGNEIVEEAGKLYQQASGLLTSLQTSVLLEILDELGKEGGSSGDMMATMGDPEALLQGLNKFQLGVFLDSLAKEGRLALPSVYLAVKPTAKGMVEARAKLLEFEAAAVSEGEATPVTTEGKWPAKGVAFSGGVTLADELEEWWQEASPTERGPLDAKRFEKLKAALANFQLTTMWAEVDGWLTLYIGNGPEGFQLADDASQSIAGDGKLRELTQLSGNAEAWLRWRVSQEFLEGLPSWINDAPSMRAAAGAVSQRSELTHQKAMVDAFYGIAKSRSLLSLRTVAADWYGIGWRENGLRMETAGGMRKPGLDYDTEWTLGNGANAAGSLLKAHWVGDVSRQKWSWEQAEFTLSLLGAALGEWMPAELPVSKDFVNQQVMPWTAAMTDSGKAMSLAGLGREAVVAIDLLGEMPPLPSASSETLQSGTIPRVLYARTVADRARVVQSATEMVATTKTLLAQANEELGTQLLFPGVITSEDKGLDSSLILLPFSNDDFHLYAGLSDDVLLQGTSRKQAQLFKFALDQKGAADSGFLLEVDLKRGVDYLKLWEALNGTEVLPLQQADAALSQAGLEEEITLEEKMGKLRKLRYHHREVAGELRSSLTLEIAE